MRRTLWTRLALVTLALTVAAPALAAPHRPSQGVAALDLNIFTRGQDGGSVVHLSPVVHVGYKVHPKVRVTLDWGFAWSQLSPAVGDSIDDFVLGNPVIAGHYLFVDTAVFKASAGIGLGIPIISIDDPSGLSGLTGAAIEDLNLGLATGVHGLLDSPMWLPDTLTVLIPLHAHYHMHSGLTIAPGLEFLVFIPVGKGDESTEFGLNFNVDVGYDVGVVEPGLGFQLDYIPTADGDNFQSSMSIFLKAHFGQGFARVRFLMNFDSPLGFSFDDNRVWGLSVGGGAHF